MNNGSLSFEYEPAKKAPRTSVGRGNIGLSITDFLNSIGIAGGMKVRPQIAITLLACWR